MNEYRVYVNPSSNTYMQPSRLRSEAYRAGLVWNVEGENKFDALLWFRTAFGKEKFDERFENNRILIEKV